MSDLLREYLAAMDLPHGDPAVDVALAREDLFDIRPGPLPLPRPRGVHRASERVERTAGAVVARDQALGLMEGPVSTWLA